MTQKEENPINKQDDQLVDLPEQVPEKIWKKFLFTPKFILLFLMATYFLGHNIYNHFTVHTQSIKVQSKKQAQMSPEIYERYVWYAILSALFLTLYILLSRANNKAQQQKIRAQIRRQQQQKSKKAKIQQKAKKIITSFDQFGNYIGENKTKQDKASNSNDKIQKQNQQNDKLEQQRNQIRQKDIEQDQDKKQK